MMLTIRRRLNEFQDSPVNNLMAGLVMSLVLIPEAIGFASVAGFSPETGLYGAIFLTIAIAVTGSRVAMITSASGSTAVLMTGLAVHGNSLANNKGIILLLTASFFAGCFQILWGILGAGKLMKFVPKAVVSGFVNALALLIIQAELPQLGFDQLLGLERHQDIGLLPTTAQLPSIWILSAIGIAVVYLAPLLTRLIPAQLISIVVITFISTMLQLEIPKVGDLGSLPEGLHSPMLPWMIQTDQILSSSEILTITLPIAIAISLVGLLETFLTVDYIDKLTDSRTSKKNEAIGQGVSNIISSIFGGMAGCALVGESVMNNKNGANSRLSTLSTGIFILIIVVYGKNLLSEIPLAAVVAVMITIALETADSDSIKNIGKKPSIDTLLMVATFLASMATHPHNLAFGVVVGVATSELYGYFSRRKNSSKSREK